MNDDLCNDAFIIIIYTRNLCSQTTFYLHYAAQIPSDCKNIETSIHIILQSNILYVGDFEVGKIGKFGE